MTSLDRPPRDPRPLVLAGILVALALGLGVRTALGPPPHAGRALNRAETLAERGDGDAAWSVLQDLVAVRPDDPDVLGRAGRILLGADRPAEALVCLRRAAELDPGSARIRYQLAKALAAGGFPELAEVEVRAALARRPRHADAMMLGAALRAEQGDVPGTVLTLARAFVNGASNPEAWRRDPRYDPVRGDPRFVRAMQDLLLPDAFLPEETHR